MHHVCLVCGHVKMQLVTRGMTISQETAANATRPCPPDVPNCHKLEELGVPVSHWPWAEARAKRQWETRLARQLTRSPQLYSTVLVTYSIQLYTSRTLLYYTHLHPSHHNYVVLPCFFLSTYFSFQCTPPFLILFRACSRARSRSRSLSFPGVAAALFLSTVCL